MAQPDLARFTRRGLLIAPADTALVNATHGVKVIDGQTEVAFDTVEEAFDSVALGSAEVATANHRASISGTVQLYPPSVPGAAGATGLPPAHDVLLPCGMALTLSTVTETSRYTPVSAAFAAADMRYYHAGDQIDVTDARGTLSSIRLEIGQRPSAQFRLQGDYTGVTEAAVPTDIDLSDWVSPVVATNANSICTITSLDSGPTVDQLRLRAKSLNADLGHEVGTKEYTEFKSTEITARAPTATLRIAKNDLGDWDPYAYIRSGAQVRVRFRVREADLRYVALEVRGQVSGVARVDVDGDLGYEIALRLIPSSGGNDELALEFGAATTFRITGTPGAATVAVAYTFSPGLAGEYIGPVTWSVSVGALPSGLTLNTATGAITGTPSGTGTTNFTLSAADSTGTPLVATRATSITVS